VGKNLKSQGSPIATPTNLEAETNSGFEVTLRWSDNAVGEVGYRLETAHGPIAASGISGFQLLAANTRSIALATSPNTTYYFRVVAVTDTLESEPSNEVSVTTRKELSAPSLVSAYSEAPNQMFVTWNDVAGETGYLIQMSSDGGSSWSPAASAGSGMTSAEVTGLLPNTEYLVRVLSVYSYGTSDPSWAVGVLTMVPSITRISLTAGGDCGKGLSFVRSASGLVDLASYSETMSNVTYTTELGHVVGSGMYTSGILDGGPTGVEDIGRDGVSLSADTAGKIHVLAHDRTNDALRYATNASGAWVASTIDAGPAGAKPRLAFNPATGALHGLYQHSSTRLKHLVKAGGQSWAFSEVLDLAIDPSCMHALTIDPTGALHAVLIGASNQLVYAVKAPGSGVWVYQTVPLASVAVKPDWVSIALDAANNPHFALHDAQGRSLYHLTRTGATWVTEVIDQTPGADVGGWCSLMVQPGSGRLHVAYYDATHGDLRYARKDLNGIWIRRLLDAVGLVGSYASVSVNSTGVVSIAYRDDTNRSVKLAQGNP